MAVPSIDNINSYFLTRVNQYENNIYARFWTTDPFAGLIEQKPFELEMGLTPSVVTATHNLPTTYLPFSDGSIVLSAGTGNAACSPSVQNIGGGYITRSFTLGTQAFVTEMFCLTDLQFKFQWAQQARMREKGLGDFVTQYQGDWARVNNIGQINTKISTNGANSGTGYASAQNGNTNFAALAGSLPTVTPTWGLLGSLYDQLNRIGAQQNAVGMSDGTPVYALNVGAGLKRRLFQSDTSGANGATRTTVNFMDQGREYSRNFLARGIDTAINGFLPNVDLTPIRYDSGFNPIYPFVNAAATVGTYAAPNPNYLTVANGGLAVYEAFSVMARGIYSKRPRPVGPIQASLQAFNPVNYTGEVRWINNPDMATNQLGNYGFYRVDIQQAAMPEFPELGFTGITLAIDGI